MFLDFTGFSKEEAEKRCRQLVQVIKEGMKLPISIGLAESKTLAKTACKFAKKYKGYKGVCVIDTEEKREKALKLTKVEDIWGIGDKHTIKLNNIGVKTAYEFTQLSAAWVRKYMTVVGERMWNDLQGRPCIQMELIAPPKKNIMTSRGFGKMLYDIDTIAEALATYTCMGAAKLREQNSVSKRIYVFIETNEHRDDLPQYSDGIFLKLPVATNSNIELVKFTKLALKRLFKKGFMYKKAGIMLMDISDAEAVQMNVFDTISAERRKKEKIIMKVTDNINKKHGRHTITMAAAGDRKKWWIRQEKLSPCWTTRLSDLPVAM